MIVPPPAARSAGTVVLAVIHTPVRSISTIDAPLLERAVECRRHLRSDARVRHDDVEMPEAFDGRVAGALHRVEIGHVGGSG